MSTKLLSEYVENRENIRNPREDSRATVERGDWIELAHNRVQWPTLVNPLIMVWSVVCLTTPTEF
jgi:hypothetical protein